MSNNGKGYSKFSIAGLCISLVAPFLVVPFGYIAFIFPVASIILSVMGIVEARKEDKNGALLSVLGIVFSALLLFFLIAMVRMLFAHSTVYD